MLVVEFFSWWYSRGWQGIIAGAKHRLEGVMEAFSISTFLRTLFAPWRRIVTAPGRGLDAHVRAALDNSVSRLIGFIIRLAVLLAAGVMLVLFSIGSVLLIILWPCLPPLSVGLIIWGLR